MDSLNELDERLEAAIEGGDEESFSATLGELLAHVRSAGNEVPADSLVVSDLVLPYADASIGEVRDLLTDEGLIPGRTPTDA
jgi:hypothetical protein